MDIVDRVLKTGRPGFCEFKSALLSDTCPRRPHLIELKRLKNGERNYQNQNNSQQADPKAG
jgi:hypothetical protein